MSFQIVVIIIATICLIAALTFTGYSLYNYQHHTKFPPVSGECPDYWVAKNNECHNERHLGTCPDPKKFNTPHFSGHDADCNKFKWAQNCKVSWDGITNDPDICKNNKN